MFGNKGEGLLQVCISSKKIKIMCALNVVLYSTNLNVIYQFLHGSRSTVLLVRYGQLTNHKGTGSEQNYQIPKVANNQQSQMNWFM